MIKNEKRNIAIKVEITINAINVDVRVSSPLDRSVEGRMEGGR